MMTEHATVTRLFRYPVKFAARIELECAELDEFGFRCALAGCTRRRSLSPCGEWNGLATPERVATVAPHLAVLVSLLLIQATDSRAQHADRGDDAARAQQLPPGAEAISLLGTPLFAPELPAEVRADRERWLAEARAELERKRDDPDALIWVGRRTAYLGRYREAVEIFTAGIEQHPRDARFYRHRGHRHITLRRLDRAVADLEAAARLVEGKPDEVEPDGLPNPRNISTSSLQSNIWYHLGLAHYLRGDFESALPAYRECLKVSTNPDMLVATSHWLYMTLRRLGRDAEAAAVLEPIRPGMEIIENHAYHRLLLLYRGDIDPEVVLAEARAAGNTIEFPTLGYGVGNWYLYHGQRERAIEIFRAILEAGSQWAAFGSIAAEAELARGGNNRGPSSPRRP